MGKVRGHGRVDGCVLVYGRVHTCVCACGVGEGRGDRGKILALDLRLVRDG